MGKHKSANHSSSAKENISNKFYHKFKRRDAVWTSVPLKTLILPAAPLSHPPKKKKKSQINSVVSSFREGMMFECLFSVSNKTEFSTQCMKINNLSY